MARRKNDTNNTPENTQEDTVTTTDSTDAPTFSDDVDVEALEPDADVEDVEDAPETEKAEKAPAAPKRGDLPEGYVTPIGFAKIVGEQGLHTDREGNVVRDVKPQMIYSYMKNSPKDDRLETEDIEDSNGVTRKALKVEDAIAWWNRKNERAAGRKANAAAKAEKAANKGKVSQQAADETGELPAGLEEPAEEAE